MHEDKVKFDQVNNAGIRGGDHLERQRSVNGEIFLGGGNPKEWDPWGESSHLFKRRERKPLLLMLCIIDFMVCLESCVVSCCLAEL